MVKDRKRRSNDAAAVVVEPTVSVQNGSIETMKKAIVNGKKNEPELNGKSAEPKVVNGESTRVDKRTLGDRKSTSTSKEEQTANSGSLSVLLTQGIMARDSEKVDSVLSNTNYDVIQNTLRDIHPMHLLPLLKEIETRLKTRKAVDIRPWLRWTQCIFSIHMSFLSSLSNLEREVGGLLAWMRARIGHQHQLLALNGKITVIADQIARRTNKVFIAQQPHIVFNNDADSDPDDLESVKSDESGESSEEDWWDDQELKGDEEDEDDSDVSDGNESSGESQGEGMEEGSDDESEDDDDEDMEQG